MQQFCTYGSVRGAAGDRRPYRDETGVRNTALAAQCPAPAVSTLISHSAGLPLGSHAEPATAWQATMRKTSRRRSLPPHTPP